ncbi:hypothetical protein G646_gp188 [Serratia phage phiMAM1]|uniref:Uncharacterized protein n=2 Tax=Miltonvirus MAM1 TaxID=2169689 RepID=K7YJ07_9CAUD|nr:hypothetical protein G646_gp188 [Serratia phage phiMAM1]AFX93656.1 hypothetical protein MAM_188 [Serratia phage phiMAM1]ASZ78968.1 hypothetical protein 2050H1_202 [Serratia phage 2050H1]
MNKFLDFIIPRFVTEEVVFEYDEKCDGYIPMYPVDQLLPGEYPEYVGTLRCFNLFGIGLFTKMVGDLRKYKP